MKHPSKNRPTNQSPIIWLGQSADTSSICSAYPDMRKLPFLTSLGCAIRKPSLHNTHFNDQLRSKLGVTGPLMVDSGGFALMLNSQARWDVRKVSRAINRIDADVFVSLDLPPRKGDSEAVRRHRIRTSARNYDTLNQLFPSKQIMPVVHGRTLSEIDLSLQLIRRHSGKKLPWIGLGGIVPLLQHRSVSRPVSKCGPEVFIARALRIIKDAFPEAKLHAFGAGGTRTFPAVFYFGADSADSIGWRHAAGFGSIFLPLKSQRVLAGPRANYAAPRKILDDSDLADIHCCKCPICLPKPRLAERLAAFRKNFHNRSIHNAWTIANRGGPGFRDSLAAWLRWILGSITPPVSPRLPA